MGVTQDMAGRLAWSGQPAKTSTSEGGWVVGIRIQKHLYVSKCPFLDPTTLQVLSVLDIYLVRGLGASGCLTQVSSSSPSRGLSLPELLLAQQPARRRVLSFSPLILGRSQSDVSDNAQLRPVPAQDKRRGDALRA